MQTPGSAAGGLMALLPSPAATFPAHVSRRDGSRHGSDFPTQLTLWKSFTRLREESNWDQGTNSRREGFALLGDGFIIILQGFHANGLFRGIRSRCLN